MSHPTPLHPDADLALVLDEMRQSVAACGDEGLIMRVFVVGIRLALLSILDTLIGLLADFRAGRLPPLLPALTNRLRHRPVLARTVRPSSRRNPRRHRYGSRRRATRAHSAIPARCRLGRSRRDCRTERRPQFRFGVTQPGRIALRTGPPDPRSRS